MAEVVIPTPRGPEALPCLKRAPRGSLLQGQNIAIAFGARRSHPIASRRRVWRGVKNRVNANEVNTTDVTVTAEAIISMMMI